MGIKLAQSLKLEGNSLILFSNTFYQLAGKLISMSITMLVTLLIARLYGRTGYGYFNLMQSIPALFFIISDFGFNAIAAKRLSGNWEEASKLFWNILVLRLIISVFLILFTILVISFYFPYPADLKLGIYMSLLLIITHSLYASGNLIFQLKLKYSYSAIGYVLGSLLVLITTLILISQNASILWINFTYVLGGVFTFIVSLHFLKKLGISLTSGFKLDTKLWKDLTLLSAPIGLTFIFSQVHFRADSILLSRLSLPNIGYDNVETVAIYGLAYKIFEVCLVIPTFFMNAAYPLFLSKLQIGREVFIKFFYKTLLLLTMSGLAITVLGYYFAPFMINVLGGESFNDSVLVLRVLFVGIIVFFISAPFSWFIVNLGKQKVLPFIYLTAAVFNIVGNIYLIPRYSFMASAYLTWVSELIIFVLLILVSIHLWRTSDAKVN
jgi:O-antigen/teichoic acid export membrane protein